MCVSILSVFNNTSGSTTDPASKASGQSNIPPAQAECLRGYRVVALACKMTFLDHNYSRMGEIGLMTTLLEISSAMA